MCLFVWTCTHSFRSTTMMVVMMCSPTPPCLLYWVCILRCAKPSAVSVSVCFYVCTCNHFLLIMPDKVPVPHVLLLTLIYFKESLHILSDPIILLTIIAWKKKKSISWRPHFEIYSAQSCPFEAHAQSFYSRECNDFEKTFCLGSLIMY